MAESIHLTKHVNTYPKYLSMNCDLVKSFKKKLDSLTMSDYHGLNSPGLTCYLNSVLQVFFMTEDFREAVKEYCSKDATIIDAHLGKLFADLQKSMANTHDFIKKLGVRNVYEQRDAAEYFEKILCLTSPEAAKLFRGELNHKTTCLSCEARDDSRSFFWILPLAVEDSCRQTYSVEKGLKSFFKGEKLCGDNKMYCSQCNKKQDTDFGCEITLNPEILTLLLKRFSFDYKRKCNVKLYCEVDIPQTLHMQNCKYDLYAIVNHFGNLTGGHYTAQIKSFETQVWYHFNDHIVEMIKQPLFEAGHVSLSSCTAYLLMYRKVSRHREKTFHPGAHSDVEAEGRHDEAEGGSDVRHQLKDERCSGGETPKHFSADILKRSNESPKERPRPHWETQNSVVDRSHRANRAKPAETKFVKIKSNSSPSAPLLTRHLQNQVSTNEPIWCYYSPDLSRRSNSLKRDEELQCAVNAHSSCKLETKRGKNGSPSKSRGKVQRVPWR